MDAYKTDLLDLRRMDCMELMRAAPDKAWDLAIVDPPYRDQNQPTKEMRSASAASNSKRFVKTEILGKKPTNEYFTELIRVSKNQIVWGCNNFKAITEYKGFVVWVKTNIPEGFTMSMAEIASLSENLATTSKCFYETSNRNGVSIHPTQKPVALYRWLLANYAKPGDRILDTHMGSGSIAIACHYAGHHLTATELDADYFAAAVQRIRAQTAQQTLGI
jgi:site-specific DNA-methyltransferase (adenine-specific)